MVNQKHQKGQLSPGQVLRKQFYEQAVRLTGFPIEKCRDILIGEFGTFEEGKIPEYLTLLKEHATAERQIGALNHKRQALRNKIHAIPEPEPCPITGCEGVKSPDAIWKWTCSQGGYRHYMAVTGALLAHCSPDIMLARLDALMIEKEERQAAELKVHREGMEYRYELKAWVVTQVGEVSASPGTR